MSLKNAAVVIGGTIGAPTGGSTLTFADYGSVPNDVRLGVSADTDFRLRRKISAKIVEPKVQASAPNGYTQAKTVMQFSKPKLLANGKITAQTIQISMWTDIEATDAEKQELMDVGSQMLSDGDFTPTWKTQQTN